MFKKMTWSQNGSHKLCRAINETVMTLQALNSGLMVVRPPKPLAPKKRTILCKAPRSWGAQPLTWCNHQRWQKNLISTKESHLHYPSLKSRNLQPYTKNMSIKPKLFNNRTHRPSNHNLQVNNSCRPQTRLNESPWEIQSRRPKWLSRRDLMQLA